MTRILSLTATCRLAERLVRQAGGQLARDDLLGRLSALEVDEERAAAGVRLALVVGRLEAIAAPQGPLQVVPRPSQAPSQAGYPQARPEAGQAEATSAAEPAITLRLPKVPPNRSSAHV